MGAGGPSLYVWFRWWVCGGGGLAGWASEDEHISGKAERRIRVLHFVEILNAYSAVTGDNRTHRRIMNIHWLVCVYTCVCI